MELALLTLLVDGHIWVSSPDDTRDTIIANDRASASCRETYTSKDKPVAVLWWTHSFRREDTNGKGRPPVSHLRYQDSRPRVISSKSHKFDNDT
jgi:hypothetical protein